MNKNQFPEKIFWKILHKNRNFQKCKKIISFHEIFSPLWSGLSNIIIESNLENIKYIIQHFKKRKERCFIAVEILGTMHICNKEFQFMQIFVFRTWCSMPQCLWSDSFNLNSQIDIRKTSDKRFHYYISEDISRPFI